MPEYLQSSHTETCEGTEHIQQLSGARMHILRVERGYGNNREYNYQRFHCLNLAIILGVIPKRVKSWLNM